MDEEKDLNPIITNLSYLEVTLPAKVSIITKMS
ncbi:hypothetical protein CNECB9_760017 [Cupriavidus necator]|uniref:Uncharacterized protein n=1 Tax=Cupriavidus necator TaxID=106590 RepID=A0A1K0ISD7_CUPNE|nr:hypothetical protein CNECB9_760017 [Cupriavidus necator]